MPASNRVDAPLLPLLQAALAAVAPEALLSRRLRRRGTILHLPGRSLNLSRYRAIHVLGAGKAAAGMGRGMAEVLGPCLHGGVLVIPRGDPAAAVPPLTVLHSAHPLPDESSLQAGFVLLDYVDREVRPGDLVFFLMSGGASALLALPAPGVSLEEKSRLTAELLRSGAEIRELNAVRKALSAVKGGRLGRRIAPAESITLVISDIPGSPLADIGSGPTVPQPGTAATARAVLQQYGLWESVSPEARRALAASPDEECGGYRAHTVLLADTAAALEAAAGAARRSGLAARILTSCDGGEATQAARFYAAVLREIRERRRPFRAPLVLLAGGELTVTVKGTGRGGRNQEFMLALLSELSGTTAPFSALSAGSDGIDGPTPAAGAWIDHETAARAARAGLDPRAFLLANDSHSFFAALGQLVQTGPTGTNVADIRLFFLPR